MCSQTWLPGLVSVSFPCTYSEQLLSGLVQSLVLGGDIKVDKNQHMPATKYTLNKLWLTEMLNEGQDVFSNSNQVLHK
jgi:hypothetical protein